MTGNCKSKVYNFLHGMTNNVGLTSSIGDTTLGFIIDVEQDF